MDTVEKLLEIARTELGYREKDTDKSLDDPKADAGTGNHTKYARDLHRAGYYNGDKCGYAWCDVFVDWCFWMLCGRDAAKAQAMTCQTGLLGAGCRYSARYYRAAGRFFEEPRVGDQVFFGKPGQENHTGILEAVAGDRLTVIEGNSGNRVARRVYDRAQISGYGRPRYPEEDLDVLAWQVIRGNWGNGEHRRQRLAQAGHDPAAVQKRVNELMEGSVWRTD